MERSIPQKLIYFLKNGIKDVDDGYEYSSELKRILNSDECQTELSGKEMEVLREYADQAAKVGEINYYSEQRIKEIEEEIFGSRGILGYLGLKHAEKPQWPF